MRLIRGSCLTALVVVLLLGAACAHVPSAATAKAPAAPNPAPNIEETAITRERAIDVAGQQCWSGSLTLVGETRNGRAQLTTLGDASKLTAESGYIPSDTLPLTTPAWLVQMDGQAQSVGDVNPTPGGRDPTPIQITIQVTCAVTVDAKTGLVIGYSEHSI